MTTEPNQRAEKLFETLRALCGVETKQEAETVLQVCNDNKYLYPEAAASAKAIEVLVEEWPE